MLFHFRNKFPQLNPFWDKYLEYQQRVEVAAKTILLEEGKVSQHYIFIEKGLGAWSKQQVGLLFSEILPEMFQLAADGKLKLETTIVKLKDITELWDMSVPEGQHLVVAI